jgi:hypothetical protein
LYNALQQQCDALHQLYSALQQQCDVLQQLYNALQQQCDALQRTSAAATSAKLTLDVPFTYRPALSAGNGCNGRPHRGTSSLLAAKNGARPSTGC